MGVGYPGFDPNAFGPFGALFQNYFAALESFSQGKSPFGGGFAPGFDTQAATAQMTGPLKAAARCQLEILGLANRRAQALMQVPNRLAQCRTPQDLFNEQMAFWRVAGEQYRDSSLKIGEAWGQAFPWLIPGHAQPSERDYINFNGTGGKEGTTHSTRQDQPSGKQRRVA